MTVATLTSKGQITIPSEVRRELGLRQGDRLEFTVMDDGTILVRPKTRRLTDLIGIVKTDRKATLEEIEAAIRAGWGRRAHQYAPRDQMDGAGSDADAEPDGKRR